MIIILGVLFIAISFALWNWTMLNIAECFAIAVLILLVLFVILAVFSGKSDKNE